MWLTLIFPDLCTSMYIYTYYPPLAHAHPTYLTHIYPHMTHIIRMVYTYHVLTSTMREENSNISTAYC